MKNLCLLLIALLPFAVCAKPGEGFPGGAEIPNFKYIRDPAAFVSETSGKLPPDQGKALSFAKSVLALYLGAEVRGQFSIAAAEWGYQVNCTKIETMKSGKWVLAAEGFGEIFLSRNLSRIQIDYGP